MGGKKGIASRALNVAVKGATFGAVGSDGSGYAQKIVNGKEVGLMDVVFGSTGAGGAAASESVDMMTGEVPKMPVAEDPILQAKRAEAEAAAKLAKEIGERGRGLSSTILGGSVNKDNAVLKKRKLLGE